MAADDIVVYKNPSGTAMLTLSAAGNLVVAGSITSTPVTDFGASGLMTDVIAEHTAATGVTIDGLLLKDGFVFALDNQGVKYGTGADIVYAWDGTNLNVTQAAPNSAILYGVDGAGIDQKLFGDTAGAYVMFDQSADAWIYAGAAVSLRTQAGTGTGVVADVIGPDLTHGMKTVVFQATISPAAIETAVLTLPANSVVISCQANVESALTGGGTTATFGVGITGDVDAYGTAWAAGAQSDLLAKNTKFDFVGTKSAAGASIGQYAAAAVSIKLIGAATGGTSAGNTALTVGSVKIRIVYQTMMSIADAA